MQAGHAASCSDACAALCPAGVPDQRPSGQSAQAQRHPCLQPNLCALPHVSVFTAFANPWSDMHGTWPPLQTRQKNFSEVIMPLFSLQYRILLCVIAQVLKLPCRSSDGPQLPPLVVMVWISEVPVVRSSALVMRTKCTQSVTQGR